MLARFASIALTAGFIASAVHAQGPEFSYVQGGHAHGIYFHDTQFGWVAEDGGRIRYTEDGGTTWEEAEVPEDVRGQLRGIYFLDEDNGWAVGDDGVVLKSTNGGRDWDVANPTAPVMNTKSTPEPAELYDIWMFDSMTGWVVGNDGVLQSTADGGDTWSFPSGCTDPFGQLDPDPGDLYDIYFFPPDSSGDRVGLIAGDYGFVGRTMDSGCTWTVQSLSNPSALCPPAPGHDLELWGIDFSPNDPDVGWVAGGVGTTDGYLFRTDDQGATWTQETYFNRLWTTPCALGTLYDVVGVGGSDFEAVTLGYGSSTYHFETVLGANPFDLCQCAIDPNVAGPLWNQVDPVGTPDLGLGLRPPLTAAHAVDEQNVWMCGRFGIIRRMTSDGTDWVDQGTTDYIRIGAGDFIQIGMARIGCVAGTGGTIKRTTDDGLTWTTVHNIGDNGITGRSLALSSTDAGVALFSGATLLRTGDQGLTWSASPPPNPPTELNYAAFVPGTNTVYVVGTAGYVAKSENGGMSWVDVSASATTSETLLGVSFYDDNVGYAVGTAQEVIKTTDGGASWTVVSGSGAVTGEHFRGVQAYDQGDAVVVSGSSGHVWRKTATTGFRQLNLGAAATTVDLNAVQVLGNGAELFVAGDAGTVLHHDGSQWSSRKSHTGEDLYDLAFFSTSDGFAVGRQFAVVRYE